MKKLLTGFAGILAVAAVGAYVSTGTVLNAQERRIPADMFIAEDSDSFDPGLSIREQFPPIRALYEGQEITEVDQFILNKGVVFIANRSVDW